MKLEGYGIRLETLTLESAELVRIWRNQPEILCQMEYQGIISEREQRLWFESIQNDSCFYFLILFNNEPVGMIHLAKIDRNKKTAEAGLFIGNFLFSGTGLALGASLLLLDYAFEKLKLENVKAKVKNTNTAAQKYNELLGFMEEKELAENFAQFVLVKEIYFKKRENLAKLILH